MQKYINTVDNIHGDKLGGVNVKVLNQDGTTAVIYTDNGVTTTDNPLTTDLTGKVQFYAPNGRYNLQVSGVGIVTYTINDVILYDPKDDEISLAGKVSVSDLASTASGKGMDLVGDGIRASDLANTASGKGADLVANAAKKVASIAALRALRVPQGSDAQTCIVDGYAAPFVWASTSTAADNGGTVIAPNSNPTQGRWLGQMKIVSATDFGAVTSGSDTSSAIQSAINAMSAQGGGGVMLPAGTCAIANTLTVPANVTLFGLNRIGTTLNIIADVIGIKVTGGYGGLRGFSLTKTGTHTHVGIQVGDSGTNSADRTVLSDLYINGMGGHGIQVTQGNLGSIRDVTSLSNGGHGIYFDSLTANNIAWNFTGAIDVRGNTLDGLRLEDGTSASDPNASKCHFGGHIVAQSNGGRGAYIGSRSNHLTIYAESNTGNQIELGTYAYGNRIFTVEGAVVDNGQGNQVFDYTTAADYLASVHNWTIRNQLKMDDPSLIGFLTLTQDADRHYTYLLDGSSANQTVQLKNNQAGYYANFQADFLTGQNILTPVNVPDGTAQPSVGNGNLLTVNNSAATTITYFNIVENYASFYVLFLDGLTTVQHSANIQLTGKANVTPAAGTTMHFIHNGTYFYQA